jgi:hypothetical protein
MAMRPGFHWRKLTQYKLYTNVEVKNVDNTELQKEHVLGTFSDTPVVLTRCVPPVQVIVSNPLVDVIIVGWPPTASALHVAAA